MTNLDTDNTTSERLDAVESDIIRLDAKVFGNVSFDISVKVQCYVVLLCFISIGFNAFHSVFPVLDETTNARLTELEEIVIRKC